MAGLGRVFDVILRGWWFFVVKTGVEMRISAGKKALFGDMRTAAGLCGKGEGGFCCGNEGAVGRRAERRHKPEDSGK
jgi:hypothetical protein